MARTHRGVLTTVPKVRPTCKTMSGIKVMFANVRSLFNKFDEFLTEGSVDRPDVTGVIEPWLHSEICSSEIHAPGYKIFRQDRVDTGRGRGGGILLYVKKYLNWCYWY